MTLTDYHINDLAGDFGTPVIIVDEGRGLRARGTRVLRKGPRSFDHGQTSRSRRIVSCASSSASDDRGGIPPRRREQR